MATTRLATLEAMTAAINKGESDSFAFNRELVPHAVVQTRDGEQHTLLRDGSRTLHISRPVEATETSRAFIHIQDENEETTIFIDEAGNIDHMDANDAPVELTEENVTSVMSKIDSFKPPEETPDMIMPALTDYINALKAQQSNSINV